MRELWHTGIMHNRVRMIVASFLVKHLRLPWLAGAKWFWDTLVDADLAQNTMGSKKSRRIIYCIVLAKSIIEITFFNFVKKLKMLQKRANPIHFK